MIIIFFWSFVLGRNVSKAWKFIYERTVFLQKHFMYAKNWICWLSSAWTQLINSLFCWFFGFCQFFSLNLDIMEKMAFIFVFSRRKANWMMKICCWEFFCRLVLSLCSSAHYLLLQFTTLINLGEKISCSRRFTKSFDWPKWN